MKKKLIIGSCDECGYDVIEFNPYDAWVKYTHAAGTPFDMYDHTPQVLQEV